MVEIERFLGNGRMSAVFRLREDHSLAVKIIFNGKENLKKQLLQHELEIGQTLKKLGVNVLNYNSIVRVKIPEHIEKTFLKPSAGLPSLKDIVYGEMKDFCIKNKGRNVWGLIMDHIPDDVIILKYYNKNTLISQERIDYIYNQEYAKLCLLGIKPCETTSRINIMWSESQAKLYFIDFEEWDLSNLGNEKYIEEIKERIRLGKRI